MDDLIIEFLTETNESLDELDVDLVNLEQNPNDKDLLGKIFRLMHTIKGTCGFLSLPRLEKVAHHAENVLGRFRDGDLEVTPDYVTLILESIDRIKYIIGELEANGAEPDGSDADLIAKLDAVYEGKTAEAPKPAAQPERELVPGEVSLEELEAAFAAAPGPGDMAPPPAPAPKKPELAKASGNDEGSEGQKESSVSAQTLRVNVDVLENLMTMVSELVLTRNQLLQILRSNAESEFSAPLQRLNHVVSELQEGVMKTRMQPIGNAWSKLPRIIRDLSMELGKKINLEMRGQETELDRQVLEMIKDPLTHMVRNSGDHGIEPPAERVAVGKPEMGRILLNAYHEGGHIIIQISDDGKGLSLGKIKKKVLENGLATSEELDAMTPQQIQQFIFKAGFSTAEKVTSVSGRGVGMDVVRTNIEKIGGSIELSSTEGKGSTFTIKIPLTLAIVSALIVEAGAERFAIPQLSVRELVMISEHGDNRIEHIKGAPVFRLRDRLLPLVSLNNILKLEPVEAPPPEDGAEAELTRRDNNRYIVVTQVGAYEFGIIVDRVFDTEEIVVKPVATILKNMPLFSGNTILGDGSVIMILDPNGIANTTGGIEATDVQDENEGKETRLATSERKTSLLLFSVGDRAPKAVPLSLVSRLENVKIGDVEYSSGQMMVQYRGTLMPLVPFNPSVSFDGQDDMPVLVFSDKIHSMGLIVSEIIDIIEEHIDVKLGGNQPGLLGSAIINGKATDVVDVAYFLNNINENWFKDHGDQPYGEEDAQGKQRVLLVDDSAFFRNMLTPLLSVAGYEVTTLESPFEALKLCEDGETFDVIISDIEMPDMDGFEFAERVKADSNWQDIPMLALSSHATPQDVDRGLQVGFKNYVAKFDRQTLLAAISRTISESQDNQRQEKAAG
ncbi:MAG: hybrid sensor histidine kinase/response regulator [Alphaproteobacteria bacterium]|nr:hybrid sensor histidine kinase/response regulator [Alphaproteobacteria bacterium]